MKTETPRTDSMMLSSATSNRVFVPVEFSRTLETELNELHTKDRVRTMEHNVLVKENRALINGQEMLRVRLADCAAYLAFHGPVGSTPDTAKLLLQDVQCALGV